MSAQPHLQLVDPDTGELAEDAPTYPEALTLLNQLGVQIEMMDRDLKGKRLRIAELEADREQQAADHPLRAQVDVVHACWKAATGKRRPLHFSDVFAIAAAVNKLGFDTCLRAVIGLRYDPYTRRQRNGKLKRYDDLETAFKTFGRVSEYAGKAPDGWTPDPAKIAQIANVDEARVREWLGERKAA